jgi:molecular chaperone GrpE
MTPQSGPSGGAGDRGGPRPGPSGAPRREPTVDPRVEPGFGPAGSAATRGLGEIDHDEVFVEAANDMVEGDLDDLLTAARRERDEFRDMVQRVQADFENYKKRMVRQQTDHLERAAEDLVSKVLPVLDAFDLARAHLGEGDNVSPEGKALVAGSTLLADTLAREGLEQIGVPGEAFDPTTHEAVDRVPAGEVAPDGPVVDGPVVDGVLRAGYRWKGRVIRPAMVRVRG